MLRYFSNPIDNVPTLSVILPTRNEAENIVPLLDRLTHALSGICAEILFVDDSTDNTPEIIQEAAARSPLDVYLISRPLDRRTNGLGGAVVEGLRSARAPWNCVMDADMQHPPEVIRRLLDMAQATDSDIVVASRDFAKGTTSVLGPFRVFVSKVLTLIARL